MLTMEYSYEKDMQVKQEEAREAGRIEGRAEGEKTGLQKGRIHALKETAITLAEMGMSLDNITKAVNTDITIVKKWLLEK